MADDKLIDTEYLKQPITASFIKTVYSFDDETTVPTYIYSGQTKGGGLASWFPQSAAHLDLNNDDDESKLSFFIESYSGIIAESNMLYEFLEDQNINWVNDFPYVNSFILKNIEKIDIQNTNSFHLPSLFDYQDEIEFGQDLFNNILANNEGLKNHLIGRTPNWDSERIAKIDYAILITSIAELLYFPSIPPKVTINEYIEIAKEFSSPSSGKFINGVIDKLIKDLTERGLIVKSGRGLIS